MEVNAICCTVSSIGDKDLPEEKEFGYIQLQTVLLSVWDASHAL